MNEYSETWFRLFLDNYPPERTLAQVEFIERHLPFPSHSIILDVCCGQGRLAAPLAEKGYRVSGIDLDHPAVAAARRAAPSAVFRTLDMRNLDEMPGLYDGIICMWQSFGYFDEETNAKVFGHMASKLIAGGRLVLDVYNRAFFASNLPSGRSEIDGTLVESHAEFQDKRMTVRLSYDGVPGDVFDWHLYSPDELIELGLLYGMRASIVCTNFDESLTVRPESPNMQLVFERA